MSLRILVLMQVDRPVAGSFPACLGGQSMYEGSVNLLPANGSPQSRFWTLSHCQHFRANAE